MKTDLLNITKSLTKEQIRDIYKTYARQKHLNFMKFCWQRPSEKFLVGLHTKKICEEIDQALINFRNGISTYLLIEVCFRHGKSEIVSRYLPAHFLAEFPDCEVLLTSHRADKAYEFSKDTQSIIKSPQFAEIYPDISLQQGNQAVQTWGIDGHLGKSQYFGIQSGTAGSGGHLIIVDDFFGNREQAESLQIRTKVNETFGNDIISRAAPVSIVIVCVTSWHVDDICGLIRKKMQTDENFPKFKIIQFPAFSDKYVSGTLFPERFSKEWYLSRKATLTNEQGEYGYLSLMQCTPINKSGNLIKVDKIVKLTKEEFEKEKPFMQCVRSWDLASTEKQTKKGDPDYTVGAKVWIKKEKSQFAGVTINKVYIEDIIRGRFEALKREQIMLQTALQEENCPVVIEAYGGYKDTFTRCKTLLAGVTQVHPYTKNEDKLVKANHLEIASEVGNLHIIEAGWNTILYKEFSEFPSGNHDDIVDACAIGVNFLLNRPVLAIYSVSNMQAELDYKEEIFTSIKDKLKYGANISAGEQTYSFIRPFLKEYLQDEKHTEVMINRIKNEIDRLDKILNYKDIYGNAI